MRHVGHVAYLCLFLFVSVCFLKYQSLVWISEIMFHCMFLCLQQLVLTMFIQKKAFDGKL